MTQRISTLLLLGALAVSALLIALSTQAAELQVQVMALEIENRELAATHQHELDALRISGEDLNACKTGSRYIEQVRTQTIIRLDDDLTVCEQQLGGLDWDQAVRDVCGSTTRQCNHLLVECEDLADRHADDHWRHSERDDAEFRRVSAELDRCRDAGANP